MRGLPRAERSRLKKLVRLGTLNVGTLTGRSREKTRWKGAKAREIGEGVKLYYNGGDTKRNGTGCSEHDKDDFYLSLEEAIRCVPEGDYLSLAGDMNGHVGSGRRGVERVHGGKGIGLINPDGERILDLAIAHDLAVCSTFLAKRESQKVIYASGGRKTEVDHILVRRAALKTTVKSADGRVLRKPVEVRERWEEYFKELLNKDFPRREVKEEQPTEGPIPPWTQEEVCKAIGKTKLGKGAGPDGVPVEAWKVLGDLGISWLTQFLNRITKEDAIFIARQVMEKYREKKTLLPGIPGPGKGLRQASSGRNLECPSRVHRDPLRP
ncbi:unnamed protein product [Heligmosomoides polygyrus]|uniref:Endo/exonuclease/phosphatase domain-containing protein n=1 Tax=Heligmosomoides polygyrus TaxID=6339 RepID=A0A183G5E7_HELPZ|nr:unnamed protein product [Heligmosomoides polygyrus]